MTYIPFLVFLLLMIAVVAGEAMWLSRSEWATAGKAWGFVVTTDLIGFAVGGFISFAILGIMIMMTFGAAGTGGSSPEWSYWVLTIVALAFPPLALFLVKRLFMLLFSMPGGKRAWLFSLVAAFAAAVIVSIPPTIVFYLLDRYSR